MRIIPREDRRPFSIDACSLLANRTIESRAAGLNDAANFATAAGRGVALAFAVINAKTMLEVSELALRLAMIPQRGPAGLDAGRWNKVADFLRASKGVLGDLGGGNHFLDAVAPYNDGPLHFLIHTGSRNESGHVDNLVERPNSFDKEFNRVVRWAAENRAAIHEKVEFVFGETELLLDLPHNTYEQLADGGCSRLTVNVVIYLYSEVVMLAIRLPQSIEKRLEKLARRTGRTKTYYVREAILEHLEEIEDLYLAEGALQRIRSGEERTIPLKQVMKRHGLQR